MTKKEEVIRGLTHLAGQAKASSDQYAICLDAVKLLEHIPDSAIMERRQITVVLECESNEEYNLNEDYIKEDLEREINCCSNSYDIKSITIKEI